MRKELLYEKIEKHIKADCNGDDCRYSYHIIRNDSKCCKRNHRNLYMDPQWYIALYNRHRCYG